MEVPMREEHGAAENNFQIALNHKIRFRILELLNQKSFKYSELCKEIRVRSNLFDYHLQLLLKEGLIEKKSDCYTLSTSGQSLAPYLGIMPNGQPVIAIVLAIDYNGKIVLVKRDKEAFKGYWAIPGGRLRYGETIKNAIKRITKDETGLDVVKLKYIATVQETVIENGKEKHHFVLLLHKVIARGELKNAQAYELKKLPGKIVPSDVEMLRLNKKFATSLISSNNGKLEQLVFEIS